ncbi:uncharacterized protein GGS25DRAFT_481494 [Hypoxylon fragiforme]|uniref:uncharacterized protein n=1 Tax=Hypoxylon fragiforme TaxID=63214 RepID=UPI0020C6FF32|nr:uncharacterized protein GGS25DRAFT_481494 [Hypoxylon fragiforme]KAI2611127.1 hypothetical protein GGS25DRAFT_481494 [Hypoxylon fragiforme]
MNRPRRVVRSNPSRAAKLKMPARETRSTAAYFSSRPPSSNNNIDDNHSNDSDDADDADDDDDYDSAGSTYHVPVTSRKRKKSRNDDSPSPKKVQRRSTTPSKTITPRTSRSTATATATATTSASTSTLAATNSAPPSCPPWETLPYLVFLNIFDQVAAPIRDTSSRREDVHEAVRTLLSASQTCKHLFEPALANLYKCPPFYHQWRYTKTPHTSFSQFIDTLNLPLDTTMMNYLPKVEILQLNVGSALAKKQLVNWVRLQSVMKHLPRLSHFEFYHQADDAPYRNLDYSVRFKCSAEELMQALAARRKTYSLAEGNARPTELKSWRWNSRLTSESLSLEKLARFHLKPSFASLKKVAFVNYQLASWGLTRKVQFTEEILAEDRQRVTDLSNCILALPNLEHLVLESSTLAGEALLEQLPTTLKHLELINCWEVTGDSFCKFLLTHGNHLRSLTLNHCQSLNLAFLPLLQKSCPHLSHLQIDLSYFRHHEHYADNKPEYEILLKEHEAPAWPSSMQSIEILHMRKWSRKAAEVFFGSLVESAPDLPLLRRLVLSVALDIGWRQRLEIRDFWVDKFDKVFKRKLKPPMGFGAKRPPRASTPERTLSNLKALPKATKPVMASATTSATTPRRRSARIAEISEISPSLTPSESEVPYLTKTALNKASAMSKELKQLKGSGKLLKEQEADEEDSEDELTADHSDRSRLYYKVTRRSKRSPTEKEFVHGLCDVVDVQLDNHRPTERHFDMDDFIDSPSPNNSDPDWDGGDADVFD